MDRRRYRRRYRYVWQGLKEANTTESDWSSECMEAFSDVMKIISDKPILAYFDTEKEHILHVESNKDGLGQPCCKTGSRSSVFFAPRLLQNAYGHN